MRIRDFISENRTCQVVTLNSEIAMAAQENQELKDVVCQADLVVPDGAGIVWASRVLGELPERVAGFDLMQELLVCAANYKYCLFLGAEPGIADLAAERDQRAALTILAGLIMGF